MKINELSNPEILSLILFVFAYLVYYFSYESKLVEKWAQKLGDSETRKEYAIHIPRFIGFFTLGVLPVMLILLIFNQPINEYGLKFPNGTFVLPISLSMISLSLLVSIFRSTNGINTDFYPQIRLEQWDQKDHIRNAVSWTLYLLGYEFILRGMLFFSCVHAFGLVPAIVINSVIYSLIHIYKGKGEAFGAFFLGILLCLVAFHTNSFILPFVVHVILAVGNDLKALQTSKTD